MARPGAAVSNRTITGDQLVNYYDRKGSRGASDGEIHYMDLVEERGRQGPWRPRNASRLTRHRRRCLHFMATAKANEFPP